MTETLDFLTNATNASDNTQVSEERLYYVMDRLINGLDENHFTMEGTEHTLASAIAITSVTNNRRNASKLSAVEAAATKGTRLSLDDVFTLMMETKDRRDDFYFSVDQCLTSMQQDLKTLKSVNSRLKKEVNKTITFVGILNQLSMGGITPKQPLEIIRNLSAAKRNLARLSNSWSKYVGGLTSDLLTVFNRADVTWDDEALTSAIGIALKQNNLKQFIHNQGNVLMSETSFCTSHDVFNYLGSDYLWVRVGKLGDSPLGNIRNATYTNLFRSPLKTRTTSVPVAVPVAAPEQLNDMIATLESSVASLMEICSAHKRLADAKSKALIDAAKSHFAANPGISVEVARSITALLVSNVIRSTCPMTDIVLSTTTALNGATLMVSRHMAEHPVK